MKKLTTTLLLSSTLLMTNFAGGLTQYDLAELLLNKAQAENRIVNKDYTEDEILSFVADYKLYSVTDATAEVTTLEVRQALSDYDAVKETIGSVAGADENDQMVSDSEPVVEKNVVDQMIENAMAMPMEKAISIEELQRKVDKGQEDKELIYCYSGCHMENGEIHAAYEDGLEDAMVEAVKVAQVLATHAEKHGMMVGIDGGGNAMCVMYGETFEDLRQDNYMFKVVFMRDIDFATDQEIDGKTYSFDSYVVANNFYAGHRLEDNVLTIKGLEKWSETYNDMEEDILHAYYDALKVMDASTAEELFLKSVSDYRYSKSNLYPSESTNEFFDIQG